MVRFCFCFISIFTLSLQCFMSCLFALSMSNFTIDQSALLALKSSFTLESPHNLLSNNWSISSSVCTWIGVTCGIRHRRVTALNLTNMDLSGTIPPQLGNLTFLVDLDLTGNNFYGHLPKELAMLRRLKMINLSQNMFNGEIPSWVGGLHDLQHLILHQNNFSGFLPLFLSNLSKLETLDLSKNTIEGNIQPEIGRLSNLKILRMAGNQLSGVIPSTIFNISGLQLFSLAFNNLFGSIPKEIGGLQELRIIYLQDNRLSGSLPLTIFNNSVLQYLQLHINNFTGNLPPDMCLGLPKLESLFLYTNKFSGQLPVDWHQCKELKQLILSENEFSGHIPEDIGNLNMLQELNLQTNKLEGPIPGPFFNISSLRVLSLLDNNFQGNLPWDMCHQLPLLEQIDLAINNFVGSIPRSIGNCTALTLISFGENSFTGSIPPEIADLSNLEDLSFGNNCLTGSIPPNLFNISTLKHLYLSFNSLSGILPLNIGYGLGNIEELDLGANKLSGQIPSSFSNASKLIRLELAGNSLTGAIPDSLGNLKDLQFLNLETNNLTNDPVSSDISFLSSLTRCKQLKVLSLAQNPLHGKLPNSVGNFSSSFQDFYMWDCEITGSIPQEIGNLSGLIRLDFSGNDIGGSIPTKIKELMNLQQLNLEENRLDGSFPDEFCQLKNLDGLILSHNKIYGPMPECLGNLTFLRQLYIDSNNLTSKIPSLFWSLKDMLEINLSSNALNGSLPPEIKNLRAITLLDLSWNEISGSIPNTVGSLLTLQLLNLSHNALFGTIPKSLELLVDLTYLNVSYNKLQGEVPSGGTFVNFTAESFMMNNGLCGRSNLKVPPCVTKKIDHQMSTRKLIMLKIILPVIISVILLLSCVTLWIYWSKKTVGSTEKELSTIGVPRRISYYELLQATNTFDESNLLGKGSFGSVFKGRLPSGLVIAVKVFNFDMEAASRSFDVECEAMRNIRHRNLIKIISSCSNNVDFKALVMEFMQNGSLEKWLYAHNYCLDFFQRLNIMIDVASALEYLHHGYSTPVVHCDLKPSNILLDEDMVAHVADFGMAKLLDEGESRTQTNTVATIGYIAPEYGSKGIVSPKGDVYSYGIMLMETFTRRKPTDEMFMGDLSLKSWVNESVPQATIEVVDSNLLRGEKERIAAIVLSITSIMELALNCCADSPEERINIKDVVASLNKIKFNFM
ncbi:Receptor-like protein kinase [Quillaja saponaria]|uniref:non-specific serine/threonine protein kinase n=1 Tax=Quillaja saponaria TaxID=32244 RepID=A0AAD7M4T7_QUISA|nr:Receptor-like protein kinase [Quillaja saponaria]